MDWNSWLGIAVIALLILCCLPMFFMGRHHKHSIALTIVTLASAAALAA